MIKAIIVDDHDLFRLGIKTAITNNHPDISIVGEAKTGEEFFRLLKTVKADIVLLDIMLPDMTGIEIARKIRRRKKGMKILTISSNTNEEVIQAMVDLQIDGFISKLMGDEAILADAIRSVTSGFEYFGEDISEIIYSIYVSKKGSAEQIAEFTKQEKVIIELCREGLLSKQIADKLFISPRTVETHKKNIFSKLGINNTMEMVKYALENGIIRM
jgi:DNA-binding NarL/FixJ family response regulator